MKNKILQHVKELDNVSFAELSRAIPGFKGEQNITVPDYTNLILWAGVSAEAIEAISELVMEEKLFLVPADNMTYLIDGTTLNLPIAKNIRSYKNPRWFPAVFTHTKPKK